MITDAIMAVVLTPLRWILDAMPTMPWPSWFSTSGDGSVVEQFEEWGQYIGLLNGWFPVAEFLQAADIVFVCGAAALSIKAVRIVVSLFTGGGGSAH